MKSSTRLASAVFHLTPTRTRCDLYIISNGKKEKIASGLLKPFLAHLKTAEEQTAKGGYSILLEPDPDADAAWFTKGTVERFVRFVSTPEILERVYTLESEIFQIEEAIAFQVSTDTLNTGIENHQAKTAATGTNEGNKSHQDASEEKAIVLYTPTGHQPASNQTDTQEANSKVQLLKILETRKTVLQREQGMAFARAVAAGFDIDQMAALVSFAECFGASRLMDACLKFMELWKKKHESGQWLEIEATEAMSSRSDFSAMNSSGIMLTSVANKLNECPDQLAAENNGKTNADASADGRAPINHQVPFGHPEYFQGQFPQPMFPPWAMHSPPGTVPVFQPYPVQGMPYYQAYPGNGPLYQPPYSSMESHVGASYKTGKQRDSMDGRSSNTESETAETDKFTTPDDVELEKESSNRRKSRSKAGSSGNKRSGMVVIRNINYITAKQENSASTGSESESDSGNDTDGEDVYSGSPTIMQNKTRRSSKRKENQANSLDGLTAYDKEDTAYGKETDSGHWQAFQNCLLRSADEDIHVAKGGMFAMEENAKLKRRSNMASDPLVVGSRDPEEIQDGRMSNIHQISGNLSRLPRGSNDELLLSRGEDEDDKRSSVQRDIRFMEANGGRALYRRAGSDDFIVNGRDNQSYVESSSELLAVNGFERATNKLKGESSQGMDDESFIVPFRSMSLDQVNADDRPAIDMDSEIPSVPQDSENSKGIRGHICYEPDDLTLMPERGTERRSLYDPALDYEMQFCAENAVPPEKNRNAEKEGSKKSEKDGRSKSTLDSMDKKRTGGPIRRGKPSKMSPMEDARARADKLRSFKADLQKLKKEKEEAELKRIEALKQERQKRIAARGSSVAGQTPLTKKFPAKISPISHRGSKFSDSEPGSSSPLQRSKIRTTSLGSGNSIKAPKVKRISDGSLPAGDRLTRSVSSLSESKKENGGVTPDVKASMSRIRRLSEPKSINSNSVSSIKVRSAESVSKAKLSNVPDGKKISAIINLDKSKAATLPELKIKSSKGDSKVDKIKSPADDMTVVMNGTEPSITSEAYMKNDKTQHSDTDDNPIVEKTVVMLERKLLVPVVSSEMKTEVQGRQYNNLDCGEKPEVVTEYAAIRAPPTQMDEIHGGLAEIRGGGQFESHEVTRSFPEQIAKPVEQIYKAPHAPLSSLEALGSANPDNGKSLPIKSEMVSAAKESEKSIELEDHTIDKIPEVKESSKGFRRLLKFGKKNYTSAAGRSFESDDASVNGSEKDSSATTGSSGEAHTLKNLISQDETSTAGSASQKSSRHFSLLSPFRSKTSGKKLTT